MIEEFLDEKYQTLMSLDDKTPSKTFLVCNRQTKALMVKKILEKSQKQIYSKLANIESPYLVPIQEIVEIEENCIVYETYISGESLESILSRGALDLNTMTGYINMLLNVLAELHREDIIHRDIKPGNIIISNDGILKLLDFGIARKYDSKKQSDTVIMGTAGYAAPEQYGFLQTSKKSDIYSLGVLMNVMLTGELPAKKLAVQKPFHSIIQKCIQMDAKNRYESVEEIQLELTNQKKTMSQKIFDIVRKIPGFRSGEFPKELVASAYYFIVIPYMFSDVFKYWNTSKFAIAWFADLLIFVGPYLFAFNIFGIDDKLFNGAKKHERKGFTITLAVLCVLVGAYLAGSILNK